ncbi:MAG: isochorismatase family cysteine hydrolase [Pseudomonadota bacterium]
MPTANEFKQPQAAGKRDVMHAALPPSQTVLLLIDFINPMDFDGADELALPALEAAQATAALKRDLSYQGVRAIYVNDNFGHWHSDFDGLVKHCHQRRGIAAQLVSALEPTDSDLRVLKPRHSGFHGTPLELLLTQLDARQLILAGIATDLCVQFTAMDAFVRGYRLWVPEDCVAAESAQRKAASLEWMAFALKAMTSPSSERSPRGRRKAGDRKNAPNG